MGRGKGGPALWRTLNAYTEQEWNVFFITSNCAFGNSPKLPDSLRVIRFDRPWLKKLMAIKKVGFFARIFWWFYFQLIVFIKAIQLGHKFRIDVIYGYEIWGVPVAKALSKIWHIPMVSRFQGTTFGVSWGKRRFRNFRAWEHLVGLRIPADLVIMTNDGTQGDRVLKSLGVDSNRVRFWMNGVNWKLFENVPRPQEARNLLAIGSEHVLLTISRLTSWKRVDRTIRVLPEVVKEFPDTILIIVGDGQERGSLEELAQKFEVSEYIRFEGAIPHNEIPNYLAAADIFLSFYDLSNVGNPLLEAMMAGKCIVTLNNGDTARFVKNGYNGILLEYESLPMLPQVIKDLLSDEKRKSRLGTKAHMFAEKHFRTWGDRMDAEIQAVRDLLK